jgi:hypothetical protein
MSSSPDGLDERSNSYHAAEKAGYPLDALLQPTVLEKNMYLDVNKRRKVFYAREDTPKHLDFLEIDFPTPSFNLFMEVWSINLENSLLFPYAEHWNQEFDAIFRQSKDRFIGIGSKNILNRFLNATQFLHYKPNWHGEVRLGMRVCMYDNFKVQEGTCYKDKEIYIRVEQIDDTPIVYSPQHPWAFPLKVQVKGSGLPSRREADTPR